MMRTRISRVAAALAAASVLAGSVVTGLADAAPAPAFGPCPDGSVPEGAGVQCAAISVPMNHAEPDGPRIDLTVSRIAATGERHGVIFTNPGGPGADSLGYWAQRIEVLPPS